MPDTGRKYVHCINSKDHRSGTLWEGRYKACPIDSDAWLLNCMRYIEMNPVPAGIVVQPVEYRWSSHAANAHGKIDTITRPHDRYLAPGADHRYRQPAYRALFRDVMAAVQSPGIRDSLNQELVLDRKAFKDTIARMTSQVRRGKHGRPRRRQMPVKVSA